MTPVLTLTQIAYFAAGALDDLTGMTGGDLRGESLLGFNGGDYTAMMNAGYSSADDHHYVQKFGGTGQLKPIPLTTTSNNGGNADRNLPTSRSFTYTDGQSFYTGGTVVNLGHFDTPNGGGIKYDLDADQKLRTMYWYGRSGAGSVFSVSASAADGSLATVTRSLPANSDIGYVMQYRTKYPTTVTLQFLQTSATASEITGFAYTLPWVLPTRLKGLRAI